MLRLVVLTLVVCLIGTSSSLVAQTSITTINTSNVSGSSSSNVVIAPSDAGNSLIDDRGETFTINYGQGNNVRVDSYVAGGVTYDRFLRPDTLILNRANPSDRLVNIWYTLNSAIVDNVPPTNDIINIDSDEASDADAIYLTLNLNAGYDNILVNVDPVGGGIIEVETERVDVIWYNGMRTSEPDNAVFPIIERGGNDNIAVAAITSLNSDGTPATYSNLIGIGENGWPGVGVSFNNYIVLRRETAGTDPIPILPIGTFEGQLAQTIQGVAISFTDFGIAANTPVFGYSIFPADIVDGYTTNTGQILTTGAVSVAAGVDLADISTFPNNTNSNDSGLDYIAGISAAVASDDNLIEIVGPGGFKEALATWLKANEADDITTSTDGSTVSDWQDHWLGDNDATTGSTSNPTYRSTSSDINFNPTVDFTTSTTSLSIANNTDFNTATSYTNKGLNIAFRTDPAGVTNRQVLYEQGGLNRGINVYILSGNLHVTAWNRSSDGTGAPWNTGTNVSTISTSVSTDTEYIVTLEQNGTSGIAGTLNAYLNGANFGSLTNIGLLFADTDGIEFGGSDGDTRFGDGTSSATNSFEGEISEFIYCNEPTNFPLAQRNRIESYLAIKYGITLDQNSPINYVNSDGTVIFNTTDNAALGGYLEYNNDIAGIGRDDASELDQRQSRSENTGSVVTMATTNDVQIPSDDTWLIWGNDDGALTETGALTMPDTIDMRLTRVWRVGETNEVGTTSVSFDLTGLSLSSNANNFSLLIAGNSSAADFSNATVVSGGTFNGNTLTFTGVDLDDGQYFTLGTDFSICSPGGVEDDLALWLRADEGITTIGSAVTAWADQSINGNDAAAGTSPDLSDGTMNFNDGVDFVSASSEFLQGANGGFNTQDYFVVAIPDNTINSALSPQVVFAGDRNVGDAIDFDGGATDFAGMAFGAFTGAFTNEVLLHGVGGSTTWRSALTGTSTIPSGNPYIFNAKDNAGANGTDIYQNGVAINNATAGSFTSASNLVYVVGAYHDTASGAQFEFDGRIGEVISYSSRRTDAQRRRIQSYLALKYGVTLDQAAASADDRSYFAADGGTIWNATDNATYDSDIAGIGRDDASCLEQRQSQSANSGSIVAMGLGGIAADNVANANNFPSDDSFLIWGNDAASSTFAGRTTGVTGIGTVTERMTRIWRVDETGTVGATTIQFDLSGLGYGSNASDFQLIVSDASDLSSATLTPAASLVDDVLTFNNIDLTDGQFFTIGTARTGCGPGGVTTDLELWLRADQEVFNTGTTQATDGQTVATWADQSESAANATDGSNLTTFETNEVNFNPAIQFAQDPTSLEGSFTTTTAGLTLFTAAFYNSVSATNDAFFEIKGPGDGFNNRGFFADVRYAADNSNLVSSLTVDSWNFWSIDHPSGSTATVYENGAAFASSITTNLSIAAAGSQAYTLGDDDTGGNDFTGFLGDVIAYQGSISATERQRVETYLAVKYGVTMDQTSATNYIWSDGTTVLWNGTTNSSHNQDIAGIGRDDASCFSQKQSSSVNTDDILTVGLGTVANSNAENINSFDDDGDYLIWGNDGGATAQASANTADVPATIAERMTRIWKVQDTGTVGETELQFDLTSLGYSVADAAAFSLLVGNTTTMADATIITGGTLDGNVLSFTGIDLTDGQFFTIGTAVTTCGPGGVNTDLALWLRADEQAFSDAGSTAAVDGNNVLQWNDQSSPADNGSESNLGGGGVIEPTFETEEINFNPVLRFVDPASSNASYIETSTNTVSGDFTLISLFKTGQADGTANDFVNSPALIGASETTSDLDYGLGMENGTLWVHANSTVSDVSFDAETTTTFNDNSAHFVTATRTQSSGAITIFVDGNSETTGTGSTTALTGSNSFGIGNHSDGDEDAQFGGDIAETIVFSQVLDSEERNRVESYLALKYGLTRNGSDDGGTPSVDERDYRAADGDVIWDFDGQGTTYYNDIFGIGRDDLSCFEQTQSKSENSDALVTFNNGGSFGTNDSFIVSGNDNAVVEQVGNMERPASIKSRLNREWRVQETGTVGSISLTYDLSTITGPLGVGTNNLNQLRLLVDDDGDFTNTNSIIEPTSFDGTSNTVTFTVDFTDGQYYTLGSIEQAALPVTLVAFDASVNAESQVQLNWTTVEEINNAFYSIERSADGEDFETITLLDGAGNSQEIINYQYIDTNPLAGRSFYRLRQTDFNGEFDFSEIRSVFVETPETASEFLLYPNPVSKGESFTIRYKLPYDQQVQVQIATANGTLVNDFSEALTAGNGQLKLSTSPLSKGLNFVRLIQENGEVKVFKVLVQ